MDANHRHLHQVPTAHYQQKVHWQTLLFFINTRYPFQCQPPLSARS